MSTQMHEFLQNRPRDQCLSQLQDSAIAEVPSNLSSVCKDLRKLCCSRTKTQQAFAKLPYAMGALSRRWKDLNSPGPMAESKRATFPRLVL